MTGVYCVVLGGMLDAGGNVEIIEWVENTVSDSAARCGAIARKKDGTPPTIHAEIISKIGLPI